MPSITTYAFVLLLSVIDISSKAQTPAVKPMLDPAVLAYTTAIDHLDLNIPLDRRLVAGFMDQLASALEGLAIGRGVEDEQFFARIRRDRRELRRFADMPLGAEGREEKGHRLFSSAAQVFIYLDRKLGSSANTKAAIDALDRSGRSLDGDYPLRWQPDNVEQFLRLGGEALKQLSNTAKGGDK